MVERPIKKSERQAIAQSTEEGGEAQGTELPPQRDTPKPVRAKDKPPGKSDDHKSKGKGKGKRGSREEDQPKAPGSLATMRGPRPVKAPPEEPEPEVTEAPLTSEEDTEISAEEASSEPTAETAETTSGAG
ncbi:MAG: hypothetical protein SFY66_17510 [Oculatellaceae cyanobacterium bins.114]|nr:hypothetical protein [Oculatellaceae cyanobacterium bins.114]